MRVNFTMIKALCKRDLRLYFSNPTGYVFITLFIFISAAAAFGRERFFLNNLANLDQLNSVFPYLLLFFVPAITMGVWSEERKSGTDELLLTLPATDMEIVLGKYLSNLGVYTGALLLSLSHLVVLFWLGSPDLGLMVGNYIGYWFLGAAFIAVGMLASLLSFNVTVGFILGALMCGFFVYVPQLLGLLGDSFGRLGGGLAVFDYFNDFGRGVISIAAIVYFLSIVVVMLYVNYALLGRRHWGSDTQRRSLSIHHAVRVAALVVALCSFSVIVGRAGARIDVTAENLHSLSDETRHLIKEISPERPVFIQAYLSRDVTKEYVQTRENLVGFLREVDAVAGDRVHVIIHDTEAYSDEARDAREKFGIEPVPMQDLEGGTANVRNTFMGVAFTCGAEEDVIKFFDKGLPTEYELARSIRVVARTARKKIGVVNSQIKLFGGFDFNSFQSSPPWPVVDELKKQYEVVQISAADSISEDLDGLLVALPSSLTQEEMDNLTEYMERGNPTLLLLDPLPTVDVSLSPSEESGANVNPFMRNRGPQPQPKGNITELLNNIGIQWDKAQVVWDGYNPHPSLATLPPEVVFVGRSNENDASFDDEFTGAVGLQELVLLFPGSLSQGANKNYQFEPIIRSSLVSGTANYGQLVAKSFFGIQLAPGGAPHYRTPEDYVLAARVQGAEGRRGVNVIAIADIDFISDQFFQIRRRGIENLDFDNVTFFLNCMDVLVGDESFIALRRRRVRHRTLTTVEAKTRAFEDERAIEQQNAEVGAQRALQDAQGRLNEAVTRVRQREDLDEQTKQVMVRNQQEVEQRRFEAVKASIEADRDARIASSREMLGNQVQRIQSNIRTLAGLIPPIPVFVMGIMIFVRRRRREKEGAAAARRLRSR